MCPESPEARERRLARAREWKRLNAKAHAQNVAEYRRRFPEKARAQNAVAHALSNGTLVKATGCAECGRTEDLCAHHEDYTKALDVVWLCRPCHIRHHREDLNRGPRKSNASVAKLKEFQVIRIRELLATGLLTNREISKLFDVTPENISSIRTGNTWNSIKHNLVIERGQRGAPPIPQSVMDQVHDMAARKLTQAAISRELGIANSTVSRILHGRKS